MKTEEQKILEMKYIAEHFNKNDRISWKRKRDKLDKILEEDLNPIEENILNLIKQKNEIIDKVNDVRRLMVSECVHPYDYLEHKETFIECKFCGARIGFPKTLEIEVDGKE